MADDNQMKNKLPTKAPRMMRGRAVVEKPKNFKKSILSIVKHLKPYRLSIALVIFSAIISTMFAIVSPKILGNMTTEIVKGLIGGHGINFDNIRNIGLWLIGIYILSAIFSYIQSWIMTRVSQEVTYNLRKDVFRKVSALPLSYFDRTQSGGTVSLITNDIETISQNLNQSIIQVITAVTTILGILIMMLTISWQMTLIAIVVLPVSMFTIQFVVKRSSKFYASQQSSISEINGYVDEMFSNHVIVKTFNGEMVSIEKFNKINHQLYDSAWKAQFLSGLMMPIMQFISNMGYVGVAVVGGILAINGKINIGDIQAFIQYMNQFTQPLSQVANISNILQNTAAAAERVFNFLSETEESNEGQNLKFSKMIEGEVLFDDVNFSYQPGKKVIKGFSAAIKPRHNIAIVGPTGAGKTTIVNLLMRFYDIDSGKIKIDGVDISKVKRSEVRKLFGMVLQDTWIFNGTIAENIAYSRPKASREEIIKAAESAHIDHLINTLPQGYDTVISEDADIISTGEKQLLTIARAILADAPMLILDEATSSVDTRTEALIQSAMSKLSHGRTSFVIAHRLSTIRSADVIFVMKDGDIIEQGCHDELINLGGYYNELYNSQFSNT